MHTFIAVVEHVQMNISAYCLHRPRPQAMHYMVEWLDKNEILTVPDWLDPADYSDPADLDEGRLSLSFSSSHLYGESL
jgi:hypothetical protein